MIGVEVDISRCSIVHSIAKECIWTEFTCLMTVDLGLNLVASTSVSTVEVPVIRSKLKRTKKPRGVCISNVLERVLI